MEYGYIRVSTIKQDYARQQMAFEQIGLLKENIYEEKVSGTKKAITRPEFEKLLIVLRPNDTCYFESMSRMARSMQDLIFTTNILVKEKKVKVVFQKENIAVGGSEQDNAMSSFVFNIMGAFAQFERDIISDRTKQGLCAKRQQGIKFGRKFVEVSEIVVNNILNLHFQNKPNYKIAIDLNIGRRIVDRIIKENTTVKK